MRLLRLLLVSACAACLAIVPSFAPAVAQPAQAPVAAPTQLMDINTASKKDLMTLPGIGDTYADRIIKFRPYTAKTQLVSKGVMKDNVYSKIQNLVIAKQPSK